MRHKLHDKVALRDNPTCRGTVVGRRIPNTRETEARYDLAMENGVTLKERPESSFVAVSSGGGCQIIEFNDTAVQNQEAASSTL